ncbi:MAG: hypothetical protein V9H26_04805 [Verrucomicrobiota bacterium]
MAITTSSSIRVNPPSPLARAPADGMDTEFFKELFDALVRIHRGNMDLN